jgi:hypothetical protein
MFFLFFSIFLFWIITEEALAPSVLAFDEIVAGPFAAYLKCSKVIGGDVAQHADMAQQGFKYVNPKSHGRAIIFYFII